MLKTTNLESKSGCKGKVRAESNSCGTRKRRQLGYRQKPSRPKQRENFHQALCKDKCTIAADRLSYLSSELGWQTSQTAMNRNTETAGFKLNLNAKPVKALPRYVLHVWIHKLHSRHHGFFQWEQLVKALARCYPDLSAQKTLRTGLSGPAWSLFEPAFIPLFPRCYWILPVLCLCGWVYLSTLEASALCAFTGILGTWNSSSLLGMQSMLCHGAYLWTREWGGPGPQCLYINLWAMLTGLLAFVTGKITKETYTLRLSCSLWSSLQPCSRQLFLLAWTASCTIYCQGTLGLEKLTLSMHVRPEFSSMIMSAQHCDARLCISKFCIHYRLDSGLWRPKF